MRILVVGAGAIGGYFGGRLLAAGRDVTFLVRPRRAELLAQGGVVVRSQLGDLDLPNPPTVTADGIRDSFDLIILSCKAYDLDGAIEAIAPAVGPETSILPLLNGMAHIDRLVERFGEKPVLGGLCVISTSLAQDGHIIHHNDLHFLAFGERDGSVSYRTEAVAAELGLGGFDVKLSTEILQGMWEKWVFIANAAGITCLMRAAAGDIAAAGGNYLTIALLEECRTIATRSGFPPSEESIERARKMFTEAGSPLMASMLRDVERGGPIEAEPIIGDLLRRGGDPEDYPLLRIVNVHLKAYEARRAREGSAAG
ncbi:2-dehydropantoate 2-reductase [Microbaculum marinum]|uniref:2-dehydropantoate 2-reductase n=1 Tax=Microbaculum marinum TaxID=1764581 RepID=A0AAW9RLA1_9HYPH